jgi:pimeloyl-ACP methyl ester carboxylesterase
MNTRALHSSRVMGRLFVALSTMVALIGTYLLSPHAHAADEPTIVLVHGAWADPSGWDEVVAALNKDGYQTVAPRLDLLSVAGDVATVRAALDATPGDKILVAHSYGGFVTTNAAEGRTDVLGLVFTAAFLPDVGDSIISVGVGYQQSEAFGHLVFTPTGSVFIDPDYFPQFFAQDLNPKLAQKLNEAQQPVHISVLFTPSGPAAWHSLPSWYAVSASDLIIDPAQQRFMAQRAAARVVEFDDASHAGGYTHYSSRFVKLIETAAEETAN